MLFLKSFLLLWLLFLRGSLFASKVSTKKEAPTKSLEKINLVLNFKLRKNCLETMTKPNNNRCDNLRRTFPRFLSLDPVHLRLAVALAAFLAAFSAAIASNLACSFSSVILSR